LSDPFTIGSTEDLALERTKPLSDFYVLSPCVWREDSTYHLLVRAVNRSKIASEKVARIYHGVGKTPTHFAMDQEPAIAPGPEASDRDGCEDPTVVTVDGIYYVFYSGWNQAQQRGELLLAAGPSIHRLEKQGPLFANPAQFRNAKEATVVRAADRSWRLFFEFAGDDRSQIGVASAQAINGPWKFEDQSIHARTDSWDNWHLSPGPISMQDSQRPVMLYNGADRDARWRIGWVAFDSGFTRVVARSQDPLITPPPKEEPEDTDIAFAASALDDSGGVALYYTVADRRLMRSVLNRSAGTLIGGE